MLMEQNTPGRPYVPPSRSSTLGGSSPAARLAGPDVSSTNPSGRAAVQVQVGRFVAILIVCLELSLDVILICHI